MTIQINSPMYKNNQLGLQTKLKILYEIMNETLSTAISESALSAEDHNRYVVLLRDVQSKITVLKNSISEITESSKNNPPTLETLNKSPIPQEVGSETLTTIRGEHQYYHPSQKRILTPPAPVLPALVPPVAVAGPTSPVGALNSPQWPYPTLVPITAVAGPVVDSGVVWPFDPNCAPVGSVAPATPTAPALTPITRIAATEMKFEPPDEDWNPWPHT